MYIAYYQTLQCSNTNSKFLAPAKGGKPDNNYKVVLKLKFDFKKLDLFKVNENSNFK